MMLLGVLDESLRYYIHQPQLIIHVSFIHSPNPPYIILLFPNPVQTLSSSCC